jgi:HSP20 family protein
MTLVRWRPLRDIVSIQDEMNRLFNSMMSPSERRSEVEEWIPAVDISETDDSFVVTADVPGMKAEDMKITVANNTLTLKGEKKNVREDKSENYHRIERSYGVFERTFALPSGVESENIRAKYKDGVLELRLPKSKEAKPQEIKVEA